MLTINFQGQWQRRQSNTVVRHTGIPILGLIATVTTGYFGMNIILFGEGSLMARVMHGFLASLFFLSLVMFAVSRAKRLSNFLEAVVNERLTFLGKWHAFWRVLVG